MKMCIKSIFGKIKIKINKLFSNNKKDASKKTIQNQAGRDINQANRDNIGTQINYNSEKDK